MNSAAGDRTRPFLIIGVVLFLIAVIAGGTIYSSLYNKVQPLPTDAQQAATADKEYKQGYIDWLNKDNAIITKDAKLVEQYDAEVRSGNTDHLNDYSNVLTDFPAVMYDLKNQAQTYQDIYHKVPDQAIVTQMEDVVQRFIDLSSQAPNVYSKEPPSDWWMAQNLLQKALTDYNTFEISLQTAGGPIH